MWWKIYFWIYTVLSLIGVWGLLLTLGSWNFAMWEGLVENVLLVLGTFAYVYKRKMLSKEAWKYIFYFIVVFWVGGAIYYLTRLPVLSFFETSYQLSTFEVLLSMVLSAPALYAIYRLGFKGKK